MVNVSRGPASQPGSTDLIEAVFASSRRVWEEVQGRDSALLQGVFRVASPRLIRGTVTGSIL